MAEKSGYDLKNNILFFQGERLSPVHLETRFVGFCEKCGSDLTSISYHGHRGDNLVVADCRKCEIRYLLRFKSNWDWVSDETLELTQNLREIPLERLESVFSPSELEAMFARSEGRPYTRQNLFRARKKYNKFEKLFGIKLEL
jgi:hypothetical protein